MKSRVVLGGLALAGVVGAWTAAGAADDPGQTLYDRHCGQCHGAEGRGGKGPRLVPFEWSVERTRDMIRNPDCDMPPIPASQVNDTEVAQIVGYLKGIK